MKRIELLAPAGDLEKLKVAVAYGADAVYIGGTDFGLRAKAKNFTFDEMGEGIAFAHQRGIPVYVASNIFAHNEDFLGLPEYFLKVAELGADALIISDPGVFDVARKTVPHMDIHISTQANSTNYNSALFWKDLGAKRIVVPRELSLGEIREICEKTQDGPDIEAFVHGAMCISISGRCMLSNYLSGRDANKGECSHPCRWSYALTEKTRPEQQYEIFEEDGLTYVLNSKDLCMIKHIPELIKSGIRSLKIEGRIKSSFYVGTVVKAYRQAIDDYLKSEKIYEERCEYYFSEVSKASYRGFTTGFYFGKPNHEDHIYTTSAYIRSHDFIGMVLGYDSGLGLATIEQRNKFSLGEEVEFLRSCGSPFRQIITEMYDEYGQKISEAPHPQQIIKLRVEEAVGEFDMMRREAP